jgi:hypothetical protein
MPGSGSSALLEKAMGPSFLSAGMTFPPVNLGPGAVTMELNLQAARSFSDLLALFRQMINK